MEVSATQFVASAPVNPALRGRGGWGLLVVAKGNGLLVVEAKSLFGDENRAKGVGIHPQVTPVILHGAARDPEP